MGWELIVVVVCSIVTCILIVVVAYCVYQRDALRRWVSDHPEPSSRNQGPSEYGAAPPPASDSVYGQTSLSATNSGQSICECICSLSLIISCILQTRQGLVVERMRVSSVVVSCIHGYISGSQFEMHSAKYEDVSSRLN
jgi:hypothetical protein